MQFRKIEAQNAPPFPPVEERKEERKKRIGFKVALLLFLVLATAFGLLYWYWKSRWIITTGQVVAAQVQVASLVKGRIALLTVREGDHVVQDQLLAKLVDLDLTFAVQIEAAQRDLDVARERYRRALAEVEQAKVVLERAKTVVERAEKLFLLRAITRDEWEKALLQLQKAQADQAAAQAKLSEEEAAVQGAEKLIGRAKARLDQLAILAPGDGIVSWLPRKVGEVVDHNDVLLTVMNPKEVWVEAYVSAADLSDLHDGEEALIKIEGLPNQQHRGRVSLFYPIERETKRSVQVGPQRVLLPSQLSNLIHPVKIAFTDGIPAGLRPEMLARVWIARARR